jgi:hypothetical protein
MIAGNIQGKHYCPLSFTSGIANAEPAARFTPSEWQDVWYLTV